MTKTWFGVLAMSLLLVGAAGCKQTGTAPSKATVNTTLTTKEKHSGKAIAASASSKAAAQSSQAASAITTLADPQADATPTTKESALWNRTKQAALAKLMSSWGQSMGQTYEVYGPGNDVDFYGLKVPSGLNTMKLAVGQAAIDIAWSTDGTSAADYALLTIYSDSDHAKYLEKHLYFFVIHEGVPEVLVTQQNQGNEHNWLYFNETANADLRDGFAKIINGR